MPTLSATLKRSVKVFYAVAAAGLFFGAVHVYNASTLYETPWGKCLASVRSSDEAEAFATRVAIDRIPAHYTVARSLLMNPERFRWEIEHHLSMLALQRVWVAGRLIRSADLLIIMSFSECGQVFEFVYG
jgi:hypothetical protein